MVSFYEILWQKLVTFYKKDPHREGGDPIERR